MRQPFKNNQGFTLMELLVAMTVFLLVVGLSSGVFLQTLRSQRTITNISESMNNVTITLEQIAREMRTGFDFENPSSDRIGFRDGYGNYVAYALVSLGENGSGPHAIGRCSEEICGTEDDFKPVTSSNVEIDGLRFVLKNGRVSLITVAAEVSIDSKRDEKEASITLQTSVSSRIIDKNG